MTEVYLFRHAQTNYPPELIGGRSNQVPLTEHGRHQAHQLGIWIAHNKLHPDFIAVSPAIRTLDTARIALEAAKLTHPWTVEDRLQELTKGDAEGQPRALINTESILARIGQEGHDFKYKNGESNNDGAERFHDWVGEVGETRPNQTVFGFAHGIVIRCALGKYLGWSYEEWIASEIDNVAATILQVDGPKVLDVRYNIATQI